MSITTIRMAKKRKGGKHKTPRKPVQLPETWIAVARKMAAKNRQPMMWYIVSKIAEDAEKEGVTLPQFPWDEEEKTSDKLSK
jgi:hypothetical protein